MDKLITLEVAKRFHYRRKAWYKRNAVQYQLVYDGLIEDYYSAFEGFDPNTEYTFRFQDYILEPIEHYGSMTEFIASTRAFEFLFGELIVKATFMASMVRAQTLSIPLIYKTKSGEERIVRMTPLEPTLQEYGNEHSQYVNVQDYIALVEEFSKTGAFVPPENGDTITDTTGNVARTYTVVPLAGAPVWENFGIGKQAIVIHSAMFRK